MIFCFTICMKIQVVVINSQLMKKGLIENRVVKVTNDNKWVVIIFQIFPKRYYKISVVRGVMKSKKKWVCNEL